jgi:hypothetical protein
LFSLFSICFYHNLWLHGTFIDPISTSTHLFVHVWLGTSLSKVTVPRIISYSKVLAVPGASPMYNFFHIWGYWRCRQYPRGPLYLSLFSYPRDIGGAANTPEAPHHNTYFIHEGIGGAANTLGAPSYVQLISYPKVLAVPPIPQKHLILIFIFISKRYWRCRQYPECHHTQYVFHTRGYWLCRQYPGAPHTWHLFHTRRYWRCRQYPEDHYTYTYFIPEGIGGAANTRGPSYVIFISYPRGVGGAANTPEAYHIYLYFHTQGVMAVPPIPQGPLIFIFTFIPKGYWRCRQYLRGPSNVILIS